MTGEKKDKGLLNSFIEYFYGNFVVLLLGFVSLPLLTRVLPTEEFGRTAMYTSAVSIIYIFAILGLDQSYIRFFYKEGVDRKTLILQCLKYPFILILVLSGIYLIFSDFFNSFLFGRTSLDITLLVIAYTVTSVFERFLFLNIRMEQNGKLYSNLNILSKALYIAFILIFVKIIGKDFRVVLYALTLPLVIVTAGLFVRYFFVKHKEKHSDHPVTQKELLSYGIPFVPMLLMEWLLSSMDKWSIRIFNGYSETGVYSSAMQIMTILLTVKITFVAFWSPIAMKKYENESEETCRRFFKDTFDKVQFLSMTVAFLLTIFRGIIVLILGEDYREAISVIPFLSLMPVLSILFEMTGQGVKFTGKLKYFNYASAAAIICNLVGNTLLVPRYLGIGAAIATGITYIVYFCIGTYYSKKCYPVDYDLKGLVISLVLYTGYAAFATVTKDQILSALVGLVIFMVHALVNKGVIKDLWISVTSMIKNRNKDKGKQI
ncbi:MAG: oligosaccharide flippase family protein [Lachnospiraceae bacterium]|nr:oligosaccharide flippase family protein [Lachnospiraceae bacterium]